MIYQFRDWRLGIFRRNCVGAVEPVLQKLREANKGVLPPFLTHWEDICVFAGGFKISLPENEQTARSVTFNTEGYPCLKWVCQQYADMLVYLSAKPEGRKLLDDPPTVPVVTAEPGFDQLTAGSVSNTEGDKTCLVASHPT